VLKKFSITALISLVSFTSILLGFLLGFFIKQPITTFGENFFEAKVTKPLIHLVEGHEFPYYTAEPYASFNILTQSVIDLDENPDKINYAQQLMTGYLKFQLPKINDYCKQIYPNTSIYKDCFETILLAEKQINKHQAHNQALKRTP